MDSNVNYLTQPDWLPLYWQNEQSGILRQAVEAFVRDSLNRTTSMSEDQILLIVVYLTQYILSPCWQNGNGGQSLARLRSEVKDLKTVEDINRWLDRASELGIDPL